jgi:hypothetical protein
MVKIIGTALAATATSIGKAVLTERTFIKVAEYMVKRTKNKWDNLVLDVIIGVYHGDKNRLSHGVQGLIDKWDLKVWSKAAQREAEAKVKKPSN